MPELLSKSAEQKLVNAVKSVIELTNKGGDPNQSIAKVASDVGFNKDFTERMIEMYNASRTLAHFQNAPREKRAEDFPIAEPQKVFTAMYGDPKTESLVGEMGKQADLMSIKQSAPAPLMEKAAEALPRDPQHFMRKAVNAHTNLDRLEKIAKQELADLKYARHKEITKLAQYFVTVGHSPFQEIERRALAKHAEIGKQVMDVAWGLIPDKLKTKEKRATLPTSPLATPDAEPYKTIERVVGLTYKIAEQQEVITKAAADRTKFAADLTEVLTKHHKIAASDDAEGETDDTEDTSDQENLDKAFGGDALLPFSKTLPPAKIRKSLQKKNTRQTKSEKPSLTSKQAGLAETAGVGTMSFLLGSGLGVPVDKIMGGKGSNDKMFAKAIDPLHNAAMRSIRVESMLQNLISNDPVISRYDPADVIDNYNTLARMIPRSAEQELLVRGYLRRMLEQNSVFEPFESQQSLDTENKLTERGQLAPNLVNLSSLGLPPSKAGAPKA